MRILTATLILTRFQPGELAPFTGVPNVGNGEAVETAA